MLDEWSLKSETPYSVTNQSDFSALLGGILSTFSAPNAQVSNLPLRNILTNLGYPNVQLAPAQDSNLGSMKNQMSAPVPAPVLAAASMLVVTSTRDDENSVCSAFYYDYQNLSNHSQTIPSLATRS